MIFDRLEHASIYRSISPHLARAIDYARTAPADLPPGRIDIDGDRLFAVVHAYDTKPVDTCKWEAHRRYIDLQLMLLGTERMDVADLATMTASTPFDTAKDIAFFDEPSSFATLLVPAGSFAVFFPHDVHRPGVAASTPAGIRKMVLKIAAGG